MTVVTQDIPVVVETDVDSDGPVSFETYMKLYYSAEDGYKYEWNNGKLEKTQAMKQTETAIVDLLMRLFIGTKTFQNGGLWSPEIDMWTSESQFRRPDISIYLANQKEDLVNGNNPIAPWVGEVISPTDNINRVQRKMHEYFAAGVQVVWHIFPDFEEVYVYTAPNQVTICDGERICSGQPALEDFEISAADIFAYKKLLKTQE